VLVELARGNYPWAPELVLSLIQRESGGKVGAVNQSSGASGLMQVMPGTLNHYNAKTGAGVPLSELRAKTPTAAVKQIIVGLWVLGTYWKSAFKWLNQENQGENIPLDELARFSDSFYAAGPGRMKELTRRQPRPLKWAEWERRHPTSDITRHANAIWSNTVANNPTWNLQDIDSYVRGGQQIDPIIPVDPEPTQRQGFLVALIIIAVVSYYLKTK
jgi:soluble lytic murein transglycosylase-like protein